MKDNLWTGTEIIPLIQAQGSTQWGCTGISIDSRTLVPGDLFIALKGPRFNGHDFLEQAFAKGACAALIQESPKAVLPAHAPLIRVDNTLTALYQLARKARERFQGRILALTGSVGKTTTKEGLRHALSASDSVFASPGSFNNHLGAPLSLARLDPCLSYGVFELGMNHAKEIEPLAHMVRPYAAMITNVSYQHGANFPSLDDIIVAKSEIFSAGCEVGILYRDSPYFERMKALGQAANWLTFGTHPESDIRLITSYAKPSGLEVQAQVRGKIYSYTLANASPHWITNSLAILAGVTALGGDIGPASASLASFKPLPGRGQRLDIAGITVIDDSYNAAYESMVAALRAFAQEEGNKYILLGQMLELGEQTALYHEALYEPLLHSEAKGLWFCGPSMRLLADRLPMTLGYADKVDEVIPSILEILKPRDKILVKGSRGSKTFCLIDALYRYHDLEEQALAYPLRSYL